MTKDATVITCEQWKYTITPTNSYKTKTSILVTLPRCDNWQEVPYEKLKPVFKCHLTWHIHNRMQDLIDKYILAQNGDINDIEERKLAAHELNFCFYDRCLERAISLHFEWLHGGCCLSGTYLSHFVYQCRNVFDLKKEEVIGAVAKMGNNNITKQISQGLENVPKEDKIGIHTNGLISKFMWRNLYIIVINIICLVLTFKDVIICIAFLIIIQHTQFILWVAWDGVFTSTETSDAILDKAETSGVLIYTLYVMMLLAEPTPYLIRLCVEGVNQIRLHLADPLNIYQKSVTQGSSQVIESGGKLLKCFFRRNMCKSNQDKGIRYILKIWHIRNLFGVKHNMFKLKHLKYKDSRDKYYDIQDDDNYEPTVYIAHDDVVDNEEKKIDIADIFSQLKAIEKNQVPVKYNDMFIMDSDEEINVGYDDDDEKKEDVEQEEIFDIDPALMRSEQELLEQAEISERRLNIGQQTGIVIENDQKENDDSDSTYNSELESDDDV
eukprot:388420_1